MQSGSLKTQHAHRVLLARLIRRYPFLCRTQLENVQDGPPCKAEFTDWPRLMYDAVFENEKLHPCRNTGLSLNPVLEVVRNVGSFDRDEHVDNGIGRHNRDNDWIEATVQQVQHSLIFDGQVLQDVHIEYSRPIENQYLIGFGNAVLLSNFFFQHPNRGQGTDFHREDSAGGFLQMNAHVAEMKKKNVRDPAGNVVTGAKELLSTCKRQHIVLL